MNDENCTMTEQRYMFLEMNAHAFLTLPEMRCGWHFCPDWQYMLIKKGGPEKCSCDLSSWMNSA